MTVEHTPDGHHVVIKGRRWRATDPDLPEDVSTELRHHLMAARRAIGQGDESARAAVQLAKVALGERGTPWWEQTARERQNRWETGLAELRCLPAGKQG